ncbi:MAG: helix-turn-helix domain-containing protein [Kiritimatiellae bacterium]|nr:helix-turn-helix domain-containing protein [Kiritimatiellia bacterium]MDD5522195.1 helix-turn-helix domain-containing protein [Kiritimatiellia bacterium]
MKQDEFHAEVQAILRNIEKFAGKGAFYHDLYDNICLKNGRVCAFCTMCLDQLATASLCRSTTCSATMHSISSGEPYFQRCWAGLICMTIALAPGKTCRGGLSLGGFYFEGENQDLEDILKQRLSHLPEQILSRFILQLPSLTEISPSELRGLGTFALESTFSCGINSDLFFKRQNQKYLQQRKIAEAFAELRANTSQSNDVTGDIQQLVSVLEHNDREAAMQFISTYMAKILLACNWNLIKLKAHLRVILSIITSQEILRGTEWTTAISRELRYITKLEKAETTENCCYEIAEIAMEYFSKTKDDDNAKETITNRTINWLQLHYHENVNLNTIARGIGASVSSIVHHISRNLGKTYKEILGEIRITEAKKLLATTSLEITEIGIRCGFYDQSHFTKAFKKAANMTPGQFRHFLTLPKDEILK